MFPGDRVHKLLGQNICTSFHGWDIVLVVANHMKWTTYYLGVKKAFTQAKFNCRITTKLPGGCGDLFGNGKYLGHLKALYGLRQSGFF